jgi:hypothetical protein
VFQRHAGGLIRGGQPLSQFPVNRQRDARKADHQLVKDVFAKHQAASRIAGSEFEEMQSPPTFQNHKPAQDNRKVHTDKGRKAESISRDYWSWGGVSVPTRRSR